MTAAVACVGESDVRQQLERVRCVRARERTVVQLLHTRDSCEKEQNRGGLWDYRILLSISVSAGLRELTNYLYQRTGVPHTLFISLAAPPHTAHVQGCVSSARALFACWPSWSLLPWLLHILAPTLRPAPTTRYTSCLFLCLGLNIYVASSIVSISMTCRTCSATVARARKTTRLPGMSTAPSSTCTRDVCLLPTFAQRLIVSRDSTLMLAQEHLWPDSRHQLQLPSSKWCVPSPANGWVWQWRCLQAHVRRLPYVCRSCVRACARPLSTSSLTVLCSTAGNVDGVQITYPAGSGAPCPGNTVRKSLLNIKCDLSAGDGVIDNVTESSTPPCIYTIR